MATFRFVGILAGAVILLAMNGCQPPANATSDSTTNTPPPPAAAPKQPVIGLFTDFGTADSYVAQLKGAILTVDPEARLVDLTHEVTPYNIAEGAFLLDESVQEFPSGTIFVAVVDPQVGTDRAPILLKTNLGKFLVGPDNGLFERVLDREGFAGAWKLDKREFFHAGGGSYTFHARDIFGPVAAHLALGVSPSTMGSPLAEKSLELPPSHEPELAGGVVSAEVLHVDHYGNVILNFRKDSEAAARFHQGNLIKITIGRTSFAGPLVKTYAEGERNRLILLYGSNGLLEVCINQGSAVKQMKVEAGTALLLKP